jgi:fructoselysine-6-P-deglycase FrlB-like protein
MYGKLISFPQVLNSPTLAVKEATPEDLIRSTKPVTLATAKVVAAGNSGNQEDIAAAANMGRNAVTELLTTCKVNESPMVAEDGRIIPKTTRAMNLNG